MVFHSWHEAVMSSGLQEVGRDCNVGIEKLEGGSVVTVTHAWRASGLAVTTWQP